MPTHSTWRAGSRQDPSRSGAFAISTTLESVSVSLAVSRDTWEDRNVRKLKPRFKLWLSSEGVEGVFGDGKWRLLKEIDAKGSLKAACESLRISYRKAWGDLKKAQDALNVALVEKQRGGNVGGGTILTEQGKRWVEAYAKFRGDVEETVERGYEKHFKENSKKA